MKGWDYQMQTIISRMDKHGPTADVEHRELYSIPCDRVKWTRI